jgi:hypothetical protein
MADTDERRADRAPSPNAERLRQAMGWEKLPEMTPEQLARFDEDNRRAEEEAQRFYGKTAA